VMSAPPVSGRCPRPRELVSVVRRRPSGWRHRGETARRCRVPKLTIPPRLRGRQGRGKPPMRPMVARTELDRSFPSLPSPQAGEESMEFRSGAMPFVSPPCCSRSSSPRLPSPTDAPKPPYPALWGRELPGIAAALRPATAATSRISPPPRPAAGKIAEGTSRARGLLRRRSRALRVLPSSSRPITPRQKSSRAARHLLRNAAHRLSDGSSDRRRRSWATAAPTRAGLRHPAPATE